MFSESCNFVEVHASANDFKVRTNRGNKRHCKKRKQIRYFNIINLLSADAKLTVVLRVPSLKGLAHMEFDMSL